jgi:hypothetical protein
MTIELTMLLIAAILFTATAILWIVWRKVYGQWRRELDGYDPRDHAEFLRLKQFRDNVCGLRDIAERLYNVMEPNGEEGYDLLDSLMDAYAEYDGKRG